MFGGREGQSLMCIFRWSQTCLWICDGEDSCLWMSAHFPFCVIESKGDSDAGKWSRTRPEPQGPSKAPKLCANSCGFFGTATTMNLCSKCHDDFILKQEHAKMALSICCVCYERFLSVDTTSNAVIAVAVDPPATSAVPLISSIPALSAAASSTDHTSVGERES